MTLRQRLATEASTAQIKAALTDPDVADLRRYLKDHPTPGDAEFSHAFGLLRGMGADIPSIPGATCELLERAGWFKEAIEQAEAAGKPEEARARPVARLRVAGHARNC